MKLIKLPPRSASSFPSKRAVKAMIKASSRLIPAYSRPIPTLTYPIFVAQHSVPQHSIVQMATPAVRNYVQAPQVLPRFRLNDQMSLSSSNVHPQISHDYDGVPGNDHQSHGDNVPETHPNGQQQVLTSAPVEIQNVPIVQAAPIPYLTSAGQGNFPTTVTFAHANSQAVPTLSHLQGTAAIPPGVNLFFESASQNVEGTSDGGNDQTNYIVNGVDFTDHEQNESDDSDEGADHALKLDLADEAEVTEGKSKKLEYKEQFDKINEQLEKLNAPLVKEGHATESDENSHECRGDYCHDQSDYKNQKNLKEQILHLVLHNNEMENQLLGNHFPPPYGHMPGLHGLPGLFPPHQTQVIYPHQQTHQVVKQKHLAKCEHLAGHSKGLGGEEDEDEGYYKIKLKTPFGILSRLLDKFMS